MKVPELRRRLKDEGFAPGVYSIDSPLPPHEGLILERLGTSWTIEHFERGIRRELERLNDEDEACSRMYELLKKHFRPRQS